MLTIAIPNDSLLGFPLQLCWFQILSLTPQGVRGGSFGGEPVPDQTIKPLRRSRYRFSLADRLESRKPDQTRPDQTPQTTILYEVRYSSPQNFPILYTPAPSLR